MMDENTNMSGNGSNPFDREEYSAPSEEAAGNETGSTEQSNGDLNLDDLTDWLNQSARETSESQQENETAKNSQTGHDVQETDRIAASSGKKEGNSATESVILPADVNVSTGKRRKKTLPVKKPVLIAGIIVGILILIYGIGCVFYSSHFFNRACINDVDVSNASADTVVSQLKDEADDYVLTLVKRDQKTVELKGGDFDFQYDDNGAVRQVLNTQSCWQWPIGCFSDTVYSADLGYKYDDAKLQTAIDALGITTGENIEAPVNAHPAWQNGQVEIVAEVYGNTVIQDKLNAAVREALKKGDEELVLTTAGVYETPKYFTDSPEVSAAKESMELASGSSITYIIDDAQEFLDVNTFGTWLICDENMAVTVDQEQGAAYLAGLGDKYDTAGGDFSFTTSGGSQIVVSGGTYGWAVDEAAELPLMTEDILSGKDVTRAISSKGAASRSGEKTIGSTYVEISISSQTMWLYVDGSCVVSTPVVTGGPGHRTPTGVYRIESHGRNVTLKGSNDDGSTYSSFVNYWMPFYYADGDGIHDASWRGSFGGSIYQSNGSHGCVNTPYSAVQTIFNNTSDGCPVVIY